MVPSCHAMPWRHMPIHMPCKSSLEHADVPKRVVPCCVIHAFASCPAGFGTKVIGAPRTKRPSKLNKTTRPQNILSTRFCCIFEANNFRENASFRLRTCFSENQEAQMCVCVCVPGIQNFMKIVDLVRNRVHMAPYSLMLQAKSKYIRNDLRLPRFWKNSFEEAYLIWVQERIVSVTFWYILSTTATTH